MKITRQRLKEIIEEQLGDGASSWRHKIPEAEANALKQKLKIMHTRVMEVWYALTVEKRLTRDEADALAREALAEAGVLSEQDDEDQAMELGQAIIDQTPVADRETMESLTDVLRGLTTLEERVKDENLGTELERALSDAISVTTNKLESLSGE